MYQKKRVDQTVIIKIPSKATLPATVEISPGPILDAALRLSEIPGSGWEKGGEPAQAIMSKALGVGVFVVDRRLVSPKPLRKGRPDASERIRKYNAQKGK